MDKKKTLELPVNGRYNLAIRRLQNSTSISMSDAEQICKEFAINKFLLPVLIRLGYAEKSGNGRYTIKRIPDSGELTERVMEAILVDSVGDLRIENLVLKKITQRKVVKEVKTNKITDSELIIELKKRGFIITKEVVKIIKY